MFVSQELQNWQLFFMIHRPSNQVSGLLTLNYFGATVGRINCLEDVVGNLIYVAYVRTCMMRIDTDH
jgi:hypothetical protein